MSTSTAPGSSGYYVCFKHWRLPVEEVRRRKTARARKMLRSAYACRLGTELPRCTCGGDPGHALEPRKYKRGRPFLARQRGKRMAHAPRCPFSNAPHGGKTQRIRAVELPSGGLSFKVNLKLGPKDRGADTLPDSMSSQAAAATATPKIELTGLVLDMFEHLGFDVYRPGCRRTHSSVMTSLQDLAAKSLINEHEMNDSVHLATADDASHRWTGRLEGWKKDKRGRPLPLVVIGEIAAPIRISGDGAAIDIHGISAPFSLTKAIAADAEKQYRRAWCRARARNLHKESRVLAVLVVTRDAMGEIKVHRCCLCLMSRDYLLCDSWNEVRVANKLVLHRRAFRKPLSTAPGETYRADFELLDARRRWVLEVWGLDDEDYLERKAAKIHYWLKEVGARLWQWTPRRQSDEIRRFPPPVITSEETQIPMSQLELRFA